MHSRTRSVVAAIAAGLSLAATEAGVKTFLAGDGDWDEDTNWSPVGVPSTSDRVVIPDGTVCHVNVNASADTIQVEAGGTLIIDNNRILTLYNGVDNDGITGLDHSLIDGEVIIRGGCTSSKIFFNCPGGQIPGCPIHVVWGEGAITGESETRSGIDIAAGVQLVNQLSEPGRGIRGSMTITGLTGQGAANGTFVNEGLVEAAEEAHGRMLVLGSSTILSDQNGSQWRADYLGCLVFNRESLNLKGNFVQNRCASWLIFNKSVRTCGWYVRTKDAIDPGCPGIDVLEDAYGQGLNATFEYIYFLTSAEPDEDCVNPGTSPGPSMIPCTNHYVVSADVLDCGECLNTP